MNQNFTKKSNSQQEIDWEKSKLENLYQMIDDLKQKNIKLSQSLKEETDKKNQSNTKFDEIFSKYQDVYNLICELFNLL